MPIDFHRISLSDGWICLSLRQRRKKRYQVAPEQFAGASLAAIPAPEVKERIALLQASGQPPTPQAVLLFPGATCRPSAIAAGLQAKADGPKLWELAPPPTVRAPVATRPFGEFQRFMAPLGWYLLKTPKSWHRIGTAEASGSDSS